MTVRLTLNFTSHLITRISSAHWAWTVWTVDTEQSLAKLPAPFIFGEGTRGQNKKNATCLDYKARYCIVQANQSLLPGEQGQHHDACRHSQWKKPSQRGRSG